MAPLAEDARANGYSRSRAIHHPSRSAIAEHDRELHGGLPRHKDAELGVPSFVQVGIRRALADVGHLGTRTDRRRHRLHPHVPRRERRDRIFVAVDLAGFQNADGAAADLAAGDELVGLSGQTASSLSRMRSRMRAAVRGSTISGSPESAAHSMPMSPS